MSQIKVQSKVNCKQAETVVAESELTLELGNFLEFMTQKTEVTSECVQLMTHADASWSVSVKPLETHAVLRFKVLIKPLAKEVLEKFKFVWTLHVKSSLVVERTMTDTKDSYNVHNSYLSKHVNNVGSLPLLLKVVVKHVGEQKSVCGFFDPSVPSRLAVATSLKTLLRDASLSDFKFIVEKKEFQVHKAILAASSPMMMKMFTNDMVESNNGECKVHDIEPDTFAAMLAFIYCGELQENFAVMASKLYEAARYYQIERLEAACALELRENLTEGNAIATYKWSCLFDELRELQLAAWELIKNVILKVFEPLNPLEPQQIDRILEIRKTESDFWKEIKEKSSDDP